ncbi:hypothetical protein [Bernardetia sp.]|uniref:hypothetical protein n=1 Tax=Bernardetia sp. TaxID=1937974 RepID=UPI0025BBE8A8|nr:hypothetical protein [Bernardetia sp.]
MKKDNKNYRKILFRVLNLLLMLFAWWYLYAQLKSHQSFFLQITDLYSELQKNKAILFSVFLLMLLNWLLEAKKWQILIKPLAKTTLLESLKSVWIGLSLSTFLPLGNFFGRIRHLPQKSRFHSAGALLVNGGLQFWVTMLGGIFGISQFFELEIFFTFLLFASWIFFYLLGLFFYKKCSYNLVGIGKDSKNKSKIIIWLQKNLYFASQYSQTDIINTTFFALLRYSVFLIQMILIFEAANFSLSIDKILVGSSLLFAAKSVLPVGGFLVGLSVREATALYFFSSLGESKVISLTFLLWVINIGFPVLIGSVLLLKGKKNTHLI